MAKVVEGVGKTYDEAVKNGLDRIGLSKDEVIIEVVKEPKKTFFSILEPRQVKVTITEKEIAKKMNENPEKSKEIVLLDDNELDKIKNKIKDFLDDYLAKLDVDLEVDMKYENGILFVYINGEASGLIIGHRGETLEALQIVVSAIANKGREDFLKVIVDSENYREKRTNSLKELALRQANQVIKKRKSYTFEPMSAFERKAIHTALQDHPKVKTHSVGEEPYRKVVISLK